jgi:hypothetical protein
VLGEGARRAAQPIAQQRDFPDVLFFAPRCEKQYTIT